MKTPQVPAMPGMTPLGLKPAYPTSPPYVVGAMAVRRAMMFYAKTGMKVNSAYSPANMLATAGKICGKDYGKRWNAKNSAAAIADLTAWLEANGAPV
jgi:hypothetical protein